MSSPETTIATRHNANTRFFLLPIRHLPRKLTHLSLSLPSPHLSLPHSLSRQKKTKNQKPNRQMKSRKGTLVGEDSLGNKYYENMTYQSGRHRWGVGSG